MAIRISDNHNKWQEFWQRDKTTESFRKLVEAESPEVSFYETQIYINGQYRNCLKMGRPFFVVENELKWVSDNFESFRKENQWNLQDAYINLLISIRRSACLSIVAGAGVSMDAGAPSWPALVQRILEIAINKWHGISIMEEMPIAVPDFKRYRKKGIETVPLDKRNLSRANEILKRIQDKKHTIDLLTEGAQICSDLFGQHLFTHITGVLYEKNRTPGKIHKAIANLSKPQLVRERDNMFMGWESIITYNFDDLLGEAIDENDFPRASFVMKSDGIYGDPNEQAQAAGKSGLFIPIYHLHGYTPRKLFNIKGINYVFSTKQYADTYGSEVSSIFSKIFHGFLANPVHYALYVGCSFEDEAMNNLLKDAAKALNGRYHYAVLKWPGGKSFSESSFEEIEATSSKYHEIGVRPVWVNKFDDIADLITSLE